MAIFIAKKIFPFLSPLAENLKKITQAKDGKAPFLVWFVCFALGVFCLLKSNFKSQSNDSKFYSDLVRQLDSKSLPEWIAPKWEGHYGRPADQYIRDHLMGHIIPGVLLTKLGVPHDQSLHILHLLYRILCLFLTYAIAKKFFPIEQSQVVFWALQLIPISIAFGIRGNHEQEMFFYILLSLFAALKTHENFRWSVVIIFSSIAVFLIKGVVFIFVPVMALWVYLVNRPKDKTYGFLLGEGSFFTLLSYGAVILVGLLYEMTYRKVTGLEFFSEYWKLQIVDRALALESSHSWIFQKLGNFSYYSGRTLYNSLPWSLWSICLLFNHLKKQKFKMNLSFTWNSFSGLAGKFYLSMAGPALLYVLIFSASNRTASRYIFPVYFLVATIFALYLSEHSQFFQKIQWKIQGWGVHVFSAGLWLLLTIFHLLHFQIKGP